MKQFNLKEYLANPNRKVVTGDGRNVRIICTDSKIRHYPIIALVEEPSGFENIFSYTEGGQMVSYEPSEKYDLFFAPKKHEKWSLILRESKVVAPEMLETKEEALFFKNHFPDFYSSIVKLEWEE